MTRTMTLVSLALLSLALLALGAIPLTRHATQSHLGQYSASGIVEMVDKGKCRQQICAYCPDQQVVKHLCEIKPDLWGGVIIGVADIHNPVIVTGYAARWAYWRGSLKGCLRVPVSMDVMRMVP